MQSEGSPSRSPTLRGSHSFSSMKPAQNLCLEHWGRDCPMAELWGLGTLSSIFVLVCGAYTVVSYTVDLSFSSMGYQILKKVKKPLPRPRGP